MCLVVEHREVIGHRGLAGARVERTRRVACAVDAGRSMNPALRHPAAALCPRPEAVVHQRGRICRGLAKCARRLDGNLRPMPLGSPKVMAIRI